MTILKLPFYLSVSINIWCVCYCLFHCVFAAGVSCGPPRPLENGLLQGSDFHAGSSVVYQCNAGFYLLGDAKVHCSNSGQWGGHPPACLGKKMHLMPAAKLENNKMPDVF